MSAETNEPLPSPDGLFRTTHWSVVLAAREGEPAQTNQALETLCRTYWHPLYAYVRQRGVGPADAQDLTQEFFARLLQRDFLRNVAREKGRFRSFLLVALKNFLASEWRRSQTAKRGGGAAFISWDELQEGERRACEPATGVTPEDLFEQHWAMAVMEQAMARLREEFQAAGKGAQFEQYKPYLSTEGSRAEYDGLAAELGMTPGAVSVSVHRFRRRFGEWLRVVVSHTVSGPAEVEDELQHLAQALRC